MNYKHGHELILNLISFVNNVKPSDRKEGVPFSTYGMGEETIRFVGKDANMHLTKVIDYFWKDDKELYDTLSKKIIVLELVNLIRKYKTNLLEEHVREFFKSLKGIPLQNYEIFYCLFGTNYNAAKPLELGPFKVYNTDIL